VAKKQIKKVVKVNKAALLNEEKLKIENDEEYRCTCCGHKYKKQDGNFYRSRSPIYKGNNGYLSICKPCVTELYNKFVQFYDKNEDEAAERMCQLTDMFFEETAWGATRKSNNRIAAYVPQLNLAQAKGKTYSDTLVRRWEEQEAEGIRPEDLEEDDSIDQEVVKRFGFGFASEEYDAMKYEYENWVSRYGEPMDKRQEELYVSICYLKLNLQKSIRADASSGVGAIANAYKNFIEAATTEIEDRKRKAEAERVLTPLGVLTRDMEMYTPAEFYKDKKIYKDHAQLGKYYNNVLVRALINLLSGSKDLDPEYSLSDTEE